MASSFASATQKRREVFDFLENCLSANQGVAVKIGADVTAENLKDKGIGTFQGNLGTYWVTNTVKPSAGVSQYQRRHGGSRR